jgi:type III pantothenate kinase
MLLVIDCGNTRTKWALVNDAGVMQATTICLNVDLVKSTLKQAAQKASKVLIANVAGQALAQQITQLIAPLRTNFMVAKHQAGDVINGYEQAEKLGADRWAALIAAWHINQQPTLVINAGTAITIDCLALDESGKGLFLGGTIMPGLHLMQAALTHNTAQLKVGEGAHTAFPLNTQNAIQTGCLNAAIGAIAIMLEQLEKQSGLASKLLISGGDSTAIASALTAHLKVNEKQVMIAENLVLQGLAILQKEYI